MKTKILGSVNRTPGSLIWSLAVVIPVLLAGCGVADIGPGTAQPSGTTETLSAAVNDELTTDPSPEEIARGSKDVPAVAPSEEGEAAALPEFGVEAPRAADLEEKATQPSFPPGSLDASAIVMAQEEVLAQIYEETLPSVVHIRVSRQVGQSQELVPFPNIPDFPFEFDRLPNVPRDPQEFYQRGDGSGFVWDDEGHIVTNHHVIAGADRVTVVFSDGRSLEAEVLGTDPDSDLAVLKVDLPEGTAHPAIVGDSGSLRVGQIAVAIGNPFGQEFTMTTGIVSALGRTIRSGSSPFSTPEVIQTDAPINPGNSGGPLLDRQGQVIGVNTQIISRSGASAGVGFAVPVNTAKRVVPVLIEKGSYEYAWLGISGTTLSLEVAEFMDLPADTGGALVIAVTKDGPGHQVGLRGSDKTLTIAGVEYPLGGDVIVGIDGTTVREMDDLIAYLNNVARPGDVVTLDVVRDKNLKEKIRVTLDKRPGAR